MSAGRVDLERVKERHAIADVVAAHGVALRPSGTRFVGRCPFHQDGRASLVVYPATRSFFCFGCGAEGDVIDFVRRRTGAGFREALRLLGETPVSAELPPRPTPPRRRLSLEDRLILLAATELYHETLLRTPAMLRYLETRGVDAVLARRCRLGYCDGGALVAYLRRRRLSLRRAEALGLVFPDGDETMRGRVVIPDLRDGSVGWMVGRVVDGRRPPRYRGLALERPLLGYDQVRGRSPLIVTEGPFDWLTLVGWGLPACAVLGTQPGTAALKLLREFPSVVVAFDADEAGVAGARQLVAALGSSARAITLPGGVNDVADLATRPGGREAFLHALDGARREAG